MAGAHWAPFVQLLLKAAQNYKKLWRKANLSDESAAALVSGLLQSLCQTISLMPAMKLKYLARMKR